MSPLTLIFFNFNNNQCQDKEGNIFEQLILNNFATQILDAKDEQVNANRVATNQKHLNVNQDHDLQHVLDGLLGVYPHKNIHIDLLPGLEPAHHFVYPVSMPMNKPSKRNSRLCLVIEFLKNALPLSALSASL